MALLGKEEAEELELLCNLGEYESFCGDGRCAGTGHTEDAKDPEGNPVPLYDVNGKDYFRYPRHMVTPRSRRWAAFYRHYKDGFLPVAGGILDQTARFCHAMRVIENEMNSKK